MQNPSTSRRAAITGLAALAALAAAPTAAAATSATTTVAVYLRSARAWSAPRSIVVPAGATVSVTGSAVDGWYPVSYAGRSGWIHQAQLRMGSTTTAPVIAYTVSSPANMRTGASTSYSVIRVLPRGASVKGTGRASGSYRQVVHDGTTGWVHAYHLERTQPAADVRPTLSTQYSRTFSHGGRSSRYHAIASGIDWSRPVGAMFFLDGDYAYKSGRGYAAGQSRVYDPSHPVLNAIAHEANRRNMVLIAIDTPDVYRSGLGYTWWHLMTENAAYFRAFAKKMVDSYRIDRKRLWMYGYSGGAELISIGLMNRYQSAWGFEGGGAIILGGGGSPHAYTAPSASYMRSMRATWVVGSLDRAGETTPPTWSALDAARRGYDFYRGKGFSALTMKEIPGARHRDYDLAAVIRGPLDAAGVRRIR